MEQQYQSIAQSSDEFITDDEHNPIATIQVIQQKITKRIEAEKL